MKILLNGAAGRMGKAVREVANKSFSDIEIIGVDVKGEFFSDIAKVKDFDCIVDFSSPDGFVSSINHAVRFSKPFVSGTTGVGRKEFALMKKASEKIAVLHSPNMSIGVNICFHIVDLISKRVKADVFIKEVHHRLKRDRPSGTALKLKEIIEKNSLFVDVAGLRAGDVVGEHEVVFLMDGERIALSHSALTREVFARGAIECARWISTKPKGLYSFSDFLGFGG